MIKQCFTAHSLMIYYSYLNSFSHVNVFNRPPHTALQIYPLPFESVTALGFFFLTVLILIPYILTTSSGRDHPLTCINYPASVQHGISINFSLLAQLSFLPIDRFAQIVTGRRLLGDIKSS